MSRALMTVVLCSGLVIASGSPTAASSEAATPTADASPTAPSSTPNDAPLISTTAVPDGIVGQRYHVALAAKGGLGPCTWSISSGTLPGGITLDPQTGVLAGIPTSPGAAHPTISLTDSQGASSVLTTTLSVQKRPVASLPLLMTGVLSVAEGYYAKYAVKSDGTVLAWGNNTYGSLGNGTTTGQAPSPTPIPGLTGVVSMSANDDGSQYALKADGTVWVWGNNTYGQLGTGTTLTSLSPRQVPGLTGVRSLTVDGHSVFAIRADGTVSAWGRNDYAQLGNATIRNSSTPVQVAGLVGVKSLAPSPGGVMFALRIDGTLWSWGGLSGYRAPLPAVAVPHMSGIRSLAASRALGTIYALKADGTLWTNATSYDHFAPMAGLSGVKSVSANTRDGGPVAAFAVKTDGTVWSWGENTFGVLGRETPGPWFAPPAPIPGLTGVERVAPNSFGRAIYAVKRDGTIWGWGAGMLDEFGTGFGSSAGSTVPVQVPGLGVVTDIFPGDESMYAVASDSSVWGWGHGVDRRLRDGTSGYTLPPLQLGTSNGFPAVLATGQLPAGAAISPDGTAAYVANEGSNTVSVIDPTAGTIRSTIAVGASPRGVAIRPDGAQAYVTNSGDNTVSVIDTVTGTLTAAVSVGSGWGASGVAFTPDGAKAYVTNAGEGTVAVIDVASTTLKAVVPVGVQPEDVAFTPDGSQAFVTNSADNTVSVIATAADRVAATIPAGTGPRNIAITPDGSKALVTNTGTNTISIIDIATNQVSTVQVGSIPTGIALIASGARALVAEAGSNELSVVDVASGKVLGTFPTGTSPSGVAVTPDGSRTLVTNSGGGSISMVNLGPAMSAVLPSAATVGVPYAYQFTAGGLPSPGYSVSSGSLPAGLTLDGRTGTLSGTPTVPGTSTFGVTASNGVPPDAPAAALTITVMKASTVPSTTIGAWRDFTGDGIADLLFRYADGELAAEAGNLTGTPVSVKVLSPGWPNMSAIVFPGDFNGDAKTDLLARDATGALWLYPGNGNSGLQPRIKVGGGWNSMTSILGAGDFNGDGTADVLARDTTGALWLYPGNGKGGWLARSKLGMGWNTMTALIAPRDFNGDGHPDLLARDTTGALWLYPGNGKGGWLTRTKLGMGWNTMTAIFGAGDFNGDGTMDTFARDKTGTLWLYPGNGKGGWLPRTSLRKDDVLPSM